MDGLNGLDVDSDSSWLNGTDHVGLGLVKHCTQTAVPEAIRGERVPKIRASEVPAVIKFGIL
jgi:hypothetical protein